jgi:hypothetical protein
MPTGYTSFIEDGKVKTAKQFLHLCLRAFGVCINMRDDSLKLTDDYTEDISKGYQEDINYHKKQLTSAEKKLSEIQSMTEEELCKKYIKDTSDNVQHYLKEEDKRSQNNKKYLEIRNDIENWDCNPEFQGIKDFAINQIDISMDKSDYYQKAIEKYGEPTREGFQKNKEEYLKKLIDDAKWDVDYHTEELEKAIDRKEKNLKFYNEFKEELNKLK